jgi:hypothetical protein
VSDFSAPARKSGKPSRSSALEEGEMDLPPLTAEEIAAQAAKLGTELTLEAVTDLLAAVETIEPTLGGPSAPLTAAARRPDRSGRCGHLPTRRRAGRAMTDPLSLEAAEVLHA